ncbi:MAG: hypothetical protein HY289_16955 [Planctomycetes bacterium]|nr:hypothetical protein [Planctomycetota bacterium]
MISKKIIAAMVVLMVAMGIAIYFVQEYRPFDAVSRLGYNRVELGMSLEDAEKAIGCPPGNHGYRRKVKGGSTSNYLECVESAGARAKEDMGPQITLKYWAGSHFWIEILFDENNKVIGKALNIPRP